MVRDVREELVMFRIRTKHVYAEIDRHASQDDKRVAKRPARRFRRAHLVVKGYVIDFEDTVAEPPINGRPDKRAPSHAA